MGIPLGTRCELRLHELQGQYQVQEPTKRRGRKCKDEDMDIKFGPYMSPWVVQLLVRDGDQHKNWHAGADLSLVAELYRVEETGQLSPITCLGHAVSPMTATKVPCLDVPGIKLQYHGIFAFTHLRPQFDLAGTYKFSLSLYGANEYQSETFMVCLSTMWTHEFEVAFVQKPPLAQPSTELIKQIGGGGIKAKLRNQRTRASKKTKEDWSAGSQGLVQAPVPAALRYPAHNGLTQPNGNGPGEHIHTRLEMRTVNSLTPAGQHLAPAPYSMGQLPFRNEPTWPMQGQLPPFQSQPGQWMEHLPPPHQQQPSMGQQSFDFRRMSSMEQQAPSFPPMSSTTGVDPMSGCYATTAPYGQPGVQAYCGDFGPVGQQPSIQMTAGPSSSPEDLAISAQQGSMAPMPSGLRPPQDLPMFADPAWMVSASLDDVYMMPGDYPSEHDVGQQGSMMTMALQVSSGNSMIPLAFADGQVTAGSQYGHIQEYVNPAQYQLSSDGTDSLDSQYPWNGQAFLQQG